ncbi:putative alanine racemase-domain-containing protein [Obelidium mucronatum]|nr:putative alanine racemase-domain-containing protein [Obelidium mucronatum]
MQRLNELIADNAGSLEQVQELLRDELRGQAIQRLSSASKSGSLVRFRGMVQDNGFSPQIYMTELNLIHSETGEKKSVSCHYSDKVALLNEPNSKWTIDEAANDFMFGKYGQKTPFCCVSVPGETSWAITAQSQGEDLLIERFAAMHVQGSNAKNVHIQRKTVRPEETLVIIKVYGSEPRDLQLCSINDFVGILELPEAPEEDTVEDSEIDPMSTAHMIQDEMEPFNSLPILHVVYYDSVSPLLHPLQHLEVDAKVVRGITIDYLLPFVMGDVLAAEYLLVHMVSKIRSRHDVVHTGNLPLNLHNIPTSVVSKAIINAIESLLPRVRSIPMTIEYLNKKRIAPGVFVSREAWKEIHTRPASVGGGPANAATERELAVHGLLSGELQVPDRTYVVIDEAGMDSGILKEQGVMNVRHLNDVITFAELPFAVGSGCDSPDHSSGKLVVDLSVLVLSQAKCMFDIQCVVPVQQAADYVVASVEESPQYTTVDNLNAMRAYLGAISRNEDYNISEEMNEALTSFFLTERKKTSQNGQPLYTQEAFMLRMEIARAWTLLSGEKTLSMEAWNKSGEMEAERLRRRELITAAKQSADGVVGR